ncbi:MAG: glycosyltransferase [Bacteroidales bacterium]|nr:glycosyltransferase [Bacteroidales bacterium]
MKRFYLSNMARRYKRYEKHLFSNAEAVMPISEQDKKEILSFSSPGILKYMPFGIDPGKYLSDYQGDGNTICFMGALDWIPNQHGLKWFLNMVWPTLKEKLPNLSFHIAGRNAPDWMKSLLNTERVFFHGEVTNAKAFIVNYPIMIVPLFSGSGVRIKILEGLALERAIVSTSKGVEGLDVVHGKQLMIADNPTDFCNHLIKITNDIFLQQKLSEEARSFVCAGYDNNSLKIGIAEFYNEVLA